MSDSVRALYESRDYPAMSHPLTDPAVTAVAAMLGGLDVPAPSSAAIMEIGCCSGHNLIPLAMRWPKARFTGIDLSERAIRQARSRAAAAGLDNIEFHAADLRSFVHHRGVFDFIIAHGVFSWVPDEVKFDLLRFCGSRLTSSGIATISFNIESGWRRRIPVIVKAMAILQAGAADEMEALAILRDTTDFDSPDIGVIDDMMAKGKGILPFDDFAPVNDPWSLRRFVEAAASAGLYWMGESDPGQNLPRSLAPEVIDSLRDGATDPISFQSAIDEAAARTFRSGMLCRHDASRSGGFRLGRVFDLTARVGKAPVSVSNPVENLVFRTLSARQPSAIQLNELRGILSEIEPRELAKRIHQGILNGWILPRIEPVRFHPDPPDRPWLDSFRLECARQRLPLVDVWHRPCSFPDPHYAILAAMDGSKGQDELEKLAQERVPRLDFQAWLHHLAGRGMFS